MGINFHAKSEPV